MMKSLNVCPHVSKHGLVPAGPGPGAMLESLLCTSVQGIFNIRYTPKTLYPNFVYWFYQAYIIYGLYFSNSLYIPK